MLLTETNIHNVVYFQNRLGYNISCLTVTAMEGGGVKFRVGILSRERPERWLIELTSFHKPNVESCKLTKGNLCMVVIKEFLSTFNA